jgi:hypothetical protein
MEGTFCLLQAVQAAYKQMYITYMPHLICIIEMHHIYPSHIAYRYANGMQADGSLTRWLEKSSGDPAQRLVTYVISVHKHPNAKKCDEWTTPAMDTAVVLKGTERTAEAVCSCVSP